MIKSLRLPVTPEQDISLIYQCPDNGSDKPLVIMMHGFPGGHKEGQSDLFGELEHRFETWGYPSVRLDFRGCGESDCTPADFTLDTALDDLNSVIQWAKTDAGHTQFILIGESLGGTIAVMGHNPKYVQAMILLWPALILPETDFSEIFTQENRIAAQKKDAPFIEFKGYRIGTHFVNDIYKTDLRVSLGKIDVPVLLQHGTADAEVPLAQSYYARDHMKGMVDVGVFEGGDHGLTSPNMRKVLYTNIEYFLGRLAKKLDFDAKN